MGHVDPTPVKPAEIKAIPSPAVCLESLYVPGDTAFSWASGDLAPDSAVTLGKCLPLWASVSPHMLKRQMVETLQGRDWLPLCVWSAQHTGALLSVEAC